MPIPNEKFNPGVISNSKEVKQLIEWIGGRPVPTLEELGEIQEEPKPRPVVRVQPIVSAAVPVVSGTEPPTPTRAPQKSAPPAAPVKRPMMKIPAKIAPRR